MQIHLIIFKWIFFDNSKKELHNFFTDINYPYYQDKD